MLSLSARNSRSFLRAFFAAGLLLCGLSVAARAQEAFEDVSKLSEEQRRAKLIEIYQKQIPLLESAIARNPEGPRAPISLFQLSEAYFESAKYFQAQEDKSKVGPYINKALEALETLRRKFPFYDRMPEALLMLAASYQELGQNSKAAPVLAEIASRYPNAQVTAEAAFLLGDYYFDNNNLSQAKVFYEKAAAIQKSKAYANYKLAWVAIKQSQPGTALKYFENVLALSQNLEAGSFDYSKDAIREMLWPALEVHGREGFFAYIQGKITDPEVLKTSLSTFSTQLQRKGEGAMAGKVLEFLTAQYGDSQEMGNWLGQQLEVEESLGRSDKIVAILSKLQSGGGDSEALKTKILNSAKKFHSTAQAAKDSKQKNMAYDQALAYYGAYHQFGDTSAKGLETRFYEGEALFARERFEEALESYKVSSEGEHPKKLDALWNWYLTAEKLAPGFRHSGKEIASASPQDERFLEAARAMADNSKVPLDKRRKASYQAARLVYQLNDFDRALPIFKALAERFPGSEEAKMSSQLVLDIYNLKKDYKAVAAFAKDYSSQAGANRGELNQIEQKAAFKAIQEDETQARTMEESEKISEFKKLGKRYVEFADQYPTSTLADGAMWAALQLQATVASKSNDKEFSDLRRTFKILTTKYSRSKFAGQAVNLMADFLTDMGPEVADLRDFAAYASEFEKRMRNMSASKRGPIAMMVYELASEGQKSRLRKEFLKLPLTPENKKVIALGRFDLIQEAKAKYENITLSSLKTLAANTKKKLNALDRFENDVTQFVELGDPKLSVDSLKLLAEAYSNMGNSLRQAPVPSSLEGENLQKYRAAVDEKAKTYDAKAGETRSLASETARKLGIPG